MARTQDNTGDRIVRVTGMYGDCKCIKFYRDGEQIGDSYFSICADGPTWFVEACGYETTLKVDLNRSLEENLHAVETMLKLQVSAFDALRAARAA